MGWEPITYCSECGDAFDVYTPPGWRICDACGEQLNREGKSDEQSLRELQAQEELDLQ